MYVFSSIGYVFPSVLFGGSQRWGRLGVAVSGGSGAAARQPQEQSGWVCRGGNTLARPTRPGQTPPGCTRETREALAGARLGQPLPPPY